MDKKELVEQYKNREQTGGVIVIKNALIGKWHIDSAPDLKAAKNRFEFFGSSNMKVSNDFTAQKGEGFSFEVLEELKKGENRSDKEFREDLSVLKAIWLEKLAGQDMY